MINLFCSHCTVLFGLSFVPTLAACMGYDCACPPLNLCEPLYRETRPALSKSVKLFTALWRMIDAVRAPECTTTRLFYCPPVHPARWSHVPHRIRLMDEEHFKEPLHTCSYTTLQYFIGWIVEYNGLVCKSCTIIVCTKLACCTRTVYMLYKIVYTKLSVQYKLYMFIYYTLCYNLQVNNIIVRLLYLLLNMSNLICNNTNYCGIWDQ